MTIDVLSDLLSIGTPVSAIEEVWGKRISGGDLVLGRSPTRLYLIGPKYVGHGRMHTRDCVLDAAVPFRWTEGGKEFEDVVSAFSVPMESNSNLESFATAVQSVIGFLGTHPSGQDLVDLLESWLEVLSGSMGPTENDKIGLWGELLFISMCANPVSAIRAWKWRNSDLIDFSAGTSHCEIKTSTAGHRHHSLSVEQVREGLAAGGLVFSIVTSWSPNGDSLVDLIHEVQELVAMDADASRTLAAAVTRRVGLVIQPGEVSLDRGAAERSVRFFNFLELGAPVASPSLVSGKLTFNFDSLEGANSGDSGFAAAHLQQVFP